MLSRHSRAIACAAAALTAAVAAGETRAEDTQAEGGVLSLTFENDIFAGDDQNYTNGVRLDYITPRNDLPFWGDAARDRLAPLLPGADWYAFYGLGQNIYTPTDITDPAPGPKERPYAGFAYATIGLSADSGDQLDTLALDIGLVGDGSLAERAQKLVHEAIDADKPLGWDDQIGDYVGFRLLYERKFRFRENVDLSIFDLDVAAAPHFNVALGNVDTSAGAGFTFRIGDDLKGDYGPPRVRPAVSGPGFFSASDGLGWSLFAGIEARAVARNIFLEGPAFYGPDLAVEPYRVIGDAQIGFSLEYSGVELTYTHVFRSPEYHEQTGLSQFGSVNLRAKF